MELAQVLSRVAAELALFAGVGFLLFAVNDLLVDFIYFARATWRSLTVYNRYPRAFASTLPESKDPGFMSWSTSAPRPSTSSASAISSFRRAAAHCRTRSGGSKRVSST